MDVDWDGDGAEIEAGGVEVDNDIVVRRLP